MARILIDFVESDKKMIKTLQYFANPLISGLKSFKTHLYALGWIDVRNLATLYRILALPEIKIK